MDPFVLAMTAMAALLLAGALLLRDAQLRPILFTIVGLVPLVTGILGVIFSMRGGRLAETGLGVMATTIGGIFILAARPWLLGAL